jgi:hypothetical protein
MFNSLSIKSIKSNFVHVLNKGAEGIKRENYKVDCTWDLWDGLDYIKRMLVGFPGGKTARP